MSCDNPIVASINRQARPSQCCQCVFRSGPCTANKRFSYETENQGVRAGVGECRGVQNLKTGQNGDRRSESKTPRDLQVPWGRMAARAGIEPASDFLQAVVAALTSESVRNAGAQHGAQNLCELTEVLAAWWSVAPEIRAAILTMARTARRPAL